MNRVLSDILMHVGRSKADGAPGPGSGRYPLGSGEKPWQHPKDFLTRVAKMEADGLPESEVASALGITVTQLRAQKQYLNHEPYEVPEGFLDTYKDMAKNGYSQTQIAEYFGLSTTRLRQIYSNETAAARKTLVDEAKRLRDEGMNPSEIGRIMGKNESTIRSYLNEESEARMNKANEVADILKKSVEEHGIIDVGAGVDVALGVTSTKMNAAIAKLELEGYPVYSRRVEQPTNPGQYTTLKLLCAPGTEYKDVYQIEDLYSPGTDYYSRDDGKTFTKMVYPASMDSKRLMVRYGDQGGKDMDGIVEIRRGVDDLSLGEAHYAQVRILVDGSHYIKGMAVYADDLPPGVDVRFNTNKPTGTPVEKVLKPIKQNDPVNPFGSAIKPAGQSYYDDPNGKYVDPVTGRKQSLSLINKRAEEGDWQEWSNRLPAQFLSKQRMELINRQLSLAESDKAAELDEILSLTNPPLKRQLLKTFADECDSAAVHLQAAALPRQTYKVILPVTSLTDKEVYAPGFDNGETVALIRYPHGGTFEIPILTVNNKNKEGINRLTNIPKDAIGINSNVASILSGADFDGDTVMIIPVGKNVKITSTKPLRDLKGFDPKEKYGPDEVRTDKNGVDHYYKNGKEYTVIRKSQTTQNEMGKISNLITDMTLLGAKEPELARAVKHSMVVIDAEKHHLDYHKSYDDNNIQELKDRYQNGGGASTLISMAKSQYRIPKRRGSGYVDPETGEVTYKNSGETYVDKKGNVKERMQVSTRMAETKDAFTLVSDADTAQERRYAEFANFNKALANRARKEEKATGRLKSSPSARKTYEKEYAELMAQLNEAKKNAPRERRAEIIAVSRAEAKREVDEGMTKKEYAKQKQMELSYARDEVGSKRAKISINDRQWEAIQNGAFSDSVLEDLFRYCDTDLLKQRAMPRESAELNDVQKARIRNMASSGYTLKDIANRLGMSTSTVSKYL